MKTVVAMGILTLIVCLGLIARAGNDDRAGGSEPNGARAQLAEIAGAWKDFEKPSQGTLREVLSPLQYEVTQKNGTEKAFANEYHDSKQPGIYVDVVSGEPLFSSTDKFESGSGWPSFVRPLVPENVTEHEDTSYGMVRVEVRSKHADSHLGHVFDDGPEPTGLRYCINSAALHFVPASDLPGSRYEEFTQLFADSEMEASTMTGRTETATLAGGCFWGMEDILRDIEGVHGTEVGYTGGHVENATYGDVKSGRSGHAESIQITFDPDVISYDEILRYFFRMHDPTTPNRQGNDVGTQYRSAIFYHDDGQRETAERVKKEVDASGVWKRPIVTEIVPAGEFHRAEEYHQDYLEKHPNGYTCHYLREF